MDGSLQLLTWETPPLRSQAQTVARLLSGRNRSVEIETLSPAAAADPTTVSFLEAAQTLPAAFKRRLLEGPCDIGLHPLPIQSLPESLTLAAVRNHRGRGDRLVTASETPLSALDGDRLVAASPRIRRQLASVLPDSTIVTPAAGETPASVIADVRTTALQETATTKRAADDDATFETWHQDLSESEKAALDRSLEQPVDGAVLPASTLPEPPAAATTTVSPEPICPGPGQGTLGVLTPNTELTELARSRLEEPQTRVETITERAFAATLPADVVLGVHATVRGSVVGTAVWVDAPETASITETYEFPITQHREAAIEAGKGLRSRLLDEA